MHEKGGILIVFIKASTLANKGREHRKLVVEDFAESFKDFKDKRFWKGLFIKYKTFGDNDVETCLV